MKRSATSSVDSTEIRRILDQDPVWTAYALADLQPGFAPHCQWYTVSGGDEEGVLLIFTALTPPILLTSGPPTVVAELLAELQTAEQLPGTVFISARHEHVPLIEHYYRFDLPVQGTVSHRMIRMSFRRPEALTSIVTANVTPANVASANVMSDYVVRLGPPDVPRIERLLAQGGPFTPDAFEAYQLDEGVFCGIAQADGELLAMGGTHIVDWQGGVGAIGNMYTHPHHRGQGYARLVLGAVIHTLQKGGIDNLILNVNEENHTARRLYAHYGFDAHCGFAEGIGVKRNA